jgi:hypothetical protein
METKKNEIEEKWSIKDDQAAEWLIDKTNEDLAEIRRLKISIADRIDTLQEKLQKENDKEEQIINNRNFLLAEYFNSLDDSFKKSTKTQQKYRLPSGSIIKKYPSPKFERDNLQLTNWVENANLPFIKVKKECDWANLKKVVEVAGDKVIYKETGEVVDGVFVVQQDATIEFKEE